MISRRTFVKRSSMVALAAGFPAIQIRENAPRFGQDPFSLGVASGYPLPDGVVLWTRLAPEPLLGGGLPPEPVTVSWEVADDERFSRIARSGRSRATPEYAHSVHVEVSGLEPDRWYFYRFRVGEAVSPVGRTRTAPERSQLPERLRFAFASCQQYEQGYFTAYRDMVDSNLDLIVHLGDYVYESSWGVDHVRQHEGPEPVTLDDYRNRHALYKSDPQLQAAHAACPWLVTWDDHEVDNDYADDRSENLDPAEWFLERRALAYRAYYEHMPLRRSAFPLGPHMRIYTQSRFGQLASFFMLDDRQYRSHQVCPRPGEGGANIVAECPERLDPSLSILGETQEQWLFQRLEEREARFNVIAQQTLMAELDRTEGPGRSFWTDGWDGYPQARRRLLRHVHESGVRNPIAIGGDVHSFWATELKLDFDDPLSKTVASELVCSGVTSQTTRTAEDAERARSENPHIRFVDVEPRGYVRVELAPDHATSEMRAVEDVTDPDSRVDTLRSFAVEDGVPGLQTS